MLEDLDNYGNLLAQLVTHQRASDNVCNKGSVVEGFDESPAVNVNSIYNINAIRGMRVSNTAYGASPANDLAAAGVTTAKTFCLPLVSILGTLTDKYIPLFAMTSAPIRLEVQLVSSALIPFVSLTAMASFAITNVEVIGSFIELSDQALAIVQQASGGAALTMAVDRYSSLVANATLNNSVTTISAPVPFKYSSCQAILNTIRQHSAGAITYDAYGSFNYNINEYWYQFGSESLPTKHPGSSTLGGGDHQTMFNYYCSALGAPAALDYSPFISLYSYDTLAVPVASTETANTAANNLTTISGSFGIGQELVSYPSANQDQMFSGRNTSTEDIYHNLIFNANASTPAVRFDYYCLKNDEGINVLPKAMQVY